MARYTGSVCRLCRREGAKLYLKGSRCYTKKCAFERRPTPPGQHGVRRRKVGDYGLQLREKQKVRRVYGVARAPVPRLLRRRGPALRRHRREPPPLPGARLDNVVYRLGFASSRAQARQLVGHGHFAVNGRPDEHPLLPGEAGRPDRGSRGRKAREPFKLAKETLKSHQAPEWLSVDAAKLGGSVAELPRRDQMPLDLNEQLVVEYYSR
jgi:small subunit ribosomal protein S4